MTRKQRSYTPEFKQEAASLVLDQAQASMSLGVGESLTPEQRRIQLAQREGCRRWPLQGSAPDDRTASTSRNTISPASAK